jgi:hypothetical protein
LASTAGSDISNGSDDGGGGGALGATPPAAAAAAASAAAPCVNEAGAAAVEPLQQHFVGHVVA